MIVKIDFKNGFVSCYENVTEFHIKDETVDSKKLNVFVVWLGEKKTVFSLDYIEKIYCDDEVVYENWKCKSFR